MGFNRPCLKCGTLTRNQRGYCTTHLPVRVDTPERKAKKQHLYGRGYAGRARVTRETATHCYLCGKPFTATDTIQADHLYPQLGSESPLGATHSHCNRAKGDQPHPANPHKTL